jgi:hypothetical protein
VLALVTDIEGDMEGATVCALEEEVEMETVVRLPLLFFSFLFFSSFLFSSSASL